MRFTAVTTTKGQLTIPKSVRDKLGLGRGTKVDIYPMDNGFLGKIHGKSKILDFAGDLRHLDDRQPLSEIRRKAQEIAARQIVSGLEDK